MTEKIITLLGIYLLSCFKFIAGPVMGSAAGYSVIESILITVAGMMTSVILFTLIGSKLKAIFKRNFQGQPRPVFTRRNRQIVHVWRKYGKIGIAFFTPLVLTPIGGTLIMVSFGAKKRHIYLHMLWSACFWAAIFCSSIDQILAFPWLRDLFT
ncbi:hypothetical protein LZF95_24085 [Algoriphagus sp. AGSA1]|uniref:hypothetical protein n=1 Tax=Algoriphagus sp. AGSA1 TaxID=2907213 RepID=UPI001F2C8A52|nr:hypothetical protein [Algoriphagus sp. AGSA1]MCE7057785.1 hypothetical protein [Algoriphagus sp. AGSA1]